MADRPILFSAPMVQALLAGRKTQTRRLIEPTKKDIAPGQILICEGPRFGGTGYRFAPRFDVGDRLWVKETWACHWSTDDQKPSEICSETWSIRYFADDHIRPVAVDGSVALPEQCRKKRVSIFMPRWASRLTLTVTDVRVQRLQDISEEDARAEGASCYICGTGRIDGTSENDCGCFHTKDMAIPSYRYLWDMINGTDAWEENPWVVAVSFSVERRNIDA